MKLRTKIQIYASFTVLIVILLINTAIFYLFMKISLDAEVERARAETNVIMEALASNENANVTSNTLLKAYIPSNGMIRIINKEEMALEAITKKADYYSLPLTYVTTEKREIIEGQDGVPFVMISIPFIWENGEVVTLQVSEKLTAHQEAMSTLFLVLLFASLIMIIPAALGGMVLGNFLVKPIKELTTAMTENQRKGKWKKIRLKGKSKDEIYQMGSTYNSMIDRLEESFKKQEQFVSDASHEFKTPISVIKSYTQLLERWGKDKPEVFEEATAAIRQEAERMESMTRQMLALAKNQREEDLRFETINLVHLVQDVIRTFTVTYKREITLRNDLMHTTLSCDKEKINQVLYILLDNACKYSDQEIRVSLSQSHTVAKISVQDFGDGMSDSEVNRIFDRFYRVDKARSRETGGTGLGLSIAQFIVHAHGGEITVQSKEGEGSIFTVNLPL
ncbi:sensor histidine kinase [Salirhabdus sp. Marseille-P4669]|uniref:sensor histidine kinase n=1 Tax=Salirhabdus sp. Marseille-P4669 TaxID=2042310 RepID=UPI000C7D98A2|nr:ATP-binding protein [Salirhabdus sp. Marseille-P4669]